MNKEKWTALMMTVLSVLTFVLGPIGLVIGSMNLRYADRKTQAIVLCVLGVVSIAMWVYHFTGHAAHMH